MCYSCCALEVPIAEGRSVVCQRGYDPFTQPTDFDLDDATVEAFRRGEWGYVSLTAIVVGADDSTLGECTLYGVPEREWRACAFENAAAINWVVEQAFSRAEMNLAS